jgi:hypothetical protein
MLSGPVRGPEVETGEERYNTNNYVWGSSSSQNLQHIALQNFDANSFLLSLSPTAERLG